MRGIRLLGRIAALPVVFAYAAILCGCARPKPPQSVEWTVMGTIASFKFRSPDDASKAQIVRETFFEVERLLNAHDEQSELRRLAGNRDAEILSRCSDVVRECYQAAFDMREASGGVFNPRWRGEGTMDLGGIAKGFAVDLAARRVGVCDALIDLGGNLKALGGEWRIGVAGDGVGRDSFVLVEGEACATSGEYFRGKHIKDGRTGDDAKSTCRSVTIVHPSSAMMADALSTVVFILGREEGERFISQRFPLAKAIFE